MVILGTWDLHPVAISVKPNCLTVSIDGPVEAEVFSYDYSGRLWTAFVDEISYRRGLDGKMLAKWRTPGDGRERRWLSVAESLAVEVRAWHLMTSLYSAIRMGDAQLHTPLPDLGHRGFCQVGAFDEARSQADAARYLEVYKPVGILPPDQYMAVVLQAAEGCSFNTCTFCSFYKDREFRIKKPDEFREHALAVRSLLGEGLSLRRTIFLGDANALVIPMPRLLTLLDVVHDVYDVETLGGLYAFLDGFSGEKKSASDYMRLAERGLVRVYVGLESGHDPLLRFLKKPGRASDAVRAVRGMKQGGVAVGVIVLLGVGGHQYAEAHVHDTAHVLNAMRLDRDDIVYFSELVTNEGLPYARDASRADLRPLDAEERLMQADAIERRLRFSRKGGVPPISKYDIREFVY